MPITPNNPFKWRHFPGEVILLCVRWYLRYPLAYEHVSELLVERGVAVHPTCIWRWVQTYAPELNKRCRPVWSKYSCGATVEEMRRSIPKHATLWLLKRIHRCLEIRT